MTKRSSQQTAPGPGVAIIGMSGRFPGASTPAAFWANLRGGIDSVSRFVPTELEVRSDVAAQPGYVAARSVLRDVELFDAAFFGIYPKEAELMDPQHRIFLECCYEALERGACDPSRFPGMIGVFAGCSMNTYLLRNLAHDRAFLERFTDEYQTGSFGTLLGNDKDFFPTRVAFKLNLRGPAMAVQTACSTSLVAICQACQSLLTYGCDAALAGGVSITFPQRRGHLPEEGAIASTDGAIRPFDHRAQGTIFGSGAGVLLLRRLEDAEADGDPILAVIRGFAVNNDGSMRAGYTAPSASGQSEVIAAAQAMAGVPASSISYIEAHGTGTPLGDPIEIAGLSRAFAGSDADPASCTVGTAKANVGHLDVAAGAVGAVKTVLQMAHREIPGLLHFEQLNPAIDLAGTPFRFSGQLTPWPESTMHPRRAGVSAFGVGGTNAHIVLEEWLDTSSGPRVPDRAEESGNERFPDAQQSLPSQTSILLLSAKSATALEAQRQRLQTYLAEHPDLPLAAAERTLAEGRTHFAFRDFVLARTHGEALEALASHSGSESAPPSPPPIVFVYPGQGAQRVGMAHELFTSEPVFREALQHCDSLLRPLIGESLIEALYPNAPSTEASARLNQTRLAQPAIFAVEYALTELWRSLGITPSVVLGHSVGEIAAACTAGVLSLPDALSLAAQRGALMQELRPGSMLAARMSQDEAAPLLNHKLSLAAVNGPSSIVFSGDDADVDDLAGLLGGRGVACRKLATSHAFHSAAMDAVQGPLRTALQSIAFAAPVLPWVSTQSGQMLTEESTRTGEYWVTQLRAPVQFQAAVQTALTLPARTPVFLEVGPGATITGAMRQILASAAAAKGGPAPRVVSSLDPNLENSVAPKEGASEAAASEGVLFALGTLWTLGAIPDLSSRSRRAGSPRRVELPTYPFERKRFWVSPPAFHNKGASAAEQTAAQATDTSMVRPEPNAVAQFAAMMQSLSLVPEPISQLSQPALPATPQRKPAMPIIAELKTLVSELSDLDLRSTPETASFAELGLDSLFLTQLTQAIRTKYGVKLTFREIMSTYGTFAKLAEKLAPHVAESAPASQTIQTVSAPVNPVLSIAASSPADRIPGPQPVGISGDAGVPRPLPQEPLLALFQHQLNAISELTGRQLQALAAQGVSSSGVVPALDAQQIGSDAAAPVSSGAPPSAPSQPLAASSEEKTLGTMVPLRPPELRAGESLTSAQQGHLSALTQRYTHRTGRSKQHAAEFRTVLADPRVPSGFHSQLKELVYPIVVERSRGAYLWDTDGNRYIDILNGYGSILFGHSPSFVLDALRAQIDLGFPIGPQTELAGECAQLLGSLTGAERVSFCNTGSEAVMAAIRLARTVTGRSLVVLFSGSYHGMIDEVLVKSTRAERSIPAAPGIPGESVQNMLVLEYGSPMALEVIRRRKAELAAVLVEPIQSRHPALRPVDFLKEVRAITEDSGAALIFDEVVTGFRTHPGGAQALFGIRADLATYGKVVAGGMPVGVIAGRREFMDALDGGAWRYGDESVPEVGVTFFAGTFVRHPLTMASVRSVLKHLQAEGPQLQQGVARKAEQLAGDLRSLFAEFEYPTSLEQFSSWFFFASPQENRLARLLYYHLRERGIHIQENFPCFLTTTHTDADLQEVRTAFRDSLALMRKDEVIGSIAAPGLSGARTPAQSDPLPSSTEINDDVAPRPAVLARMAAGAERAAEVAEPPRAISEAPITESQREILLASQIDDVASCAFNESVSLSLRGELDRTALLSAFKQLAGRHDVLRMTVSPDGETLHFAAPGSPEATVALTEEDWTALSGEEQRQRTQELQQREATIPFALSTGPLLRVSLLALAPDEHLLVLTGHHIAIDGWSINVLFEELGALYSAERENAPASLLPPASFAEFALSESRAKHTPEQAETEGFWKEQYAAMPPLPELPTDRSRPGLRSNSGSTYRHLFSPSWTAAVRAGAQRRNKTLFATLLAGTAALLARLANQNDLVLAVPLAGQRETEGRSFVGHAVNFLPLRLHPRSSDSFATLSEEASWAAMDALDHQRYTLGSLIRELKLQRDPSRLPLAEIQFNVEQVGSRMRFSGLEATLFPNSKAAVNADLFFNFIDRGETLVLECDYSKALFDAATIAGWSEALETLLEAAVVQPETLIAELPLMSEAKTNQVLLDWNATTTEYPRERSIAQVFEEQVRRTPEQTAVSAKEGSLTYAELDRRASELAQVLAGHRRKAASFRVALSMERGLDLIISLLAILKAGGTYVPIDPTYPAARLQLLLEDAAPDLFLTQPALLPTFVGLPVTPLTLAALRSAPPQSEQSALTEPVTAERPAYIMYTSGSTGKPKGVVVPQRAVVRLVKGSHFAHFGEDEVILQLAPVSFDASTLEIWGALLNGGRLVMMPGAKPTPEEIGATIASESVTTIWLTAALFHLMIMDHIELLQPLRQLLAGGDVLSVSHVRKLLEAAPHLRLINGYGPTENTTFTCCHTIRLEDLGGTSVPIGRPISNTRVYILDPQGHLVPPRVPGELYAAGDGLALGYLNAPELTEQRFVTKALGSAGIERLYKTGDMTRYAHDGTIEFMGRSDTQIKIRGFRVELGEIEHAAERCAGVRAAVAAARPDWTGPEDIPGDKRLALYIIPEAGADPGALKTEVRQFLRAQLPEHMQPQAVILVPSFPQTANGKVDYRALPAPAAERALREQSQDQPRTPVEGTLAAIWSKVLQVPNVGIHDSIFELGGDSLSIFRITTQAKQAGIQLTAKHIFQLKTIAALSPTLSLDTEPLTAVNKGTITAVPRGNVRKVQTL